jgi:hypothetical protein
VACQELTNLSRTYVSLGITSIKPPLGSGRRTSYDYCWHFRNAGYKAYCYLTGACLTYILDNMKQDGVEAFYANILGIRNSDANPGDLRTYYVFMRHDADWFMFKTYMSNLPEEMIQDSGANIARKLRKPYIGTL